MQSKEELLESLLEINPNYNPDLIEKAYDVGVRMHDGQLRKSGEPYFVHPLAVAKILAELGMDEQRSCAPKIAATLISLSSRNSLSKIFSAAQLFIRPPKLNTLFYQTLRVRFRLSGTARASGCTTLSSVSICSAIPKRFGEPYCSCPPGCSRLSLY